MALRYKSQHIPTLLTYSQRDDCYLLPTPIEIQLGILT